MTPSARLQRGTSGSLTPFATPLGRAHIDTLDTMRAQARPLTLRDIMRLTGLSQEELQAVIRELRELRLVTELNTVVASYLVQPTTAPSCSPNLR